MKYFIRTLIPIYKKEHCLQSLRNPQRWPGLTSSPALEVFVAFALESVLSLSLKSSTGSQSDSAGTLQSEQEPFCVNWIE